MSLINKLWIKLFYTKIGSDQFGNIYYTSDGRNYLGHKKRFVYYNGINESSKVPPLWHAWLHYLSDQVPNSENLYAWQKAYVPNLTGTKNKYNPKITKKDLKTYGAWAPSNK